MNSNAISNFAEYTVTEISGAIKKTVEIAFSSVRVRGEISGFRGPHSSGHAYFSIKDQKARMDAVVWKGVYHRLKFKPEEGMEMIATGKITTFPGSSKYQIVVEQLEPAGAGALMALLEERKKKLADEGLFDAQHKNPLPFMPKTIGVITSPTGAVIRDILHRISDRFPVHVIVWPVRVQGESSGDEVAAAIDGFNMQNTDILTPDVIIVARGGGSLEDLWGFNDENVVRAAYRSDIPLISAVGHETDWTLLDLVADQRAPTPTGAAEMAVPVKADLEADIASLAARLKSASTRNIDQKYQYFKILSRGLPSLDNLLALPRRQIDEAENNLGKALNFNMINKHQAFDLATRRLTPIALTAHIRDRKARLKQNNQSLWIAYQRINDHKVIQLAHLQNRSSSIPQQILQRFRQYADHTQQLKTRADKALINQNRQRWQYINAHDRMLQSLTYKSVLKRGYTIIRDARHIPLTSAKSVLAKQKLSIEFADGKIHVTETGTGTIKDIKNTEDAGMSEDNTSLKPSSPSRSPISPRKALSRHSSKDQGSLF